MEALVAPGAVACFARGFLHVPTLGENDCAPAWLQLLSSPSLSLATTHDLPWMPATAAPSLAAAALRAVAVPFLLGTLTITSLSPLECLANLLGHLSGPRKRWQQRRVSLCAGGDGIPRPSSGLPHLHGAATDTWRLLRVGRT